MIVGVIHPDLLRVYVYDGNGFVWHVAEDSSLQHRGLNNIPQSFDQLFCYIKLQYDVLIILSAPMPYIPDLTEAAKKYAKQVYVHPVIAGILAEFINKYFKEEMVEEVEKTFAVIIDGDGCDCYKLSRTTSTDEFRLIRADYYPPGKAINLEKTAVRPEYILVGNVKGMPRSKKSPLRGKGEIPIRNYAIKNYVLTAFNGGIKMALSKLQGYPFSGYKIKDFCEKLTVSLGGITQTVTHWDSPYDRVFKNEHHLDQNYVKVQTSNNITFECRIEGVSLKRSQNTVFTESKIPLCVATLVTRVDAFGVVTFNVEVPRYARSEEALKPVEVPVTTIYAATSANVEHRDQVYGTVFMSNKVLVIGPDGKVTASDHPDVDPVPEGTKLTENDVTDFYTRFFHAIPVSNLKSFVLGHNGTYPAALVNIAYNLAQDAFKDKQIRISIISPLTAMFFHNLRKMPIRSNESTFSSMSMFITTNMFNVIYCQHNIASGTHEITDTWQTLFTNATDALSHVRSALHDALTVNDHTTLYCDDVDQYASYCDHNKIRCKRLPSNWFEQNVLHVASHLNANKFDIVERNHQTFIKFGNSRDILLYDGDSGFVNEFQREFNMPKNVGRMKVFQRVSHCDNAEFVLFQTNSIPDDVDNVSIRMEFHGINQLPTVETDPLLDEVVPSIYKHD